MRANNTLVHHVQPVSSWPCDYIVSLDLTIYIIKIYIIHCWPCMPTTSQNYIRGIYT